MHGEGEELGRIFRKIEELLRMVGKYGREKEDYALEDVPVVLDSPFR